MPFYDSNWLLAIVTFLVGLIAFVIYEKQQNDNKKDAATIIMLEMQHAEDKLAIAKESIISSGLIKEDVFLMPTSAWEKYKYLFVRDFGDKELEDISSFYEKCKLYDEVVRYNNSFFVKNEEQIRTNLQSSLADYTKSYMSELISTTRDEEKNAAHDEYKKLINDFATTFMQEVTSSTSQYFYRPKKAFEDAKVLVNLIRTDMSTSSIGITFNGIISRNLRTAIHDFFLGIKKPKL